MEKLSVIITAYDAHELTVVHARESMNADRVPDEVIVVNDGGDPKLREMLLALPKKCRFIYARVIPDIPWNYNGACNLGAWLSSGDLLAFEDNDNIPTRSFYSDAINCFNNNPHITRVIAKHRHDLPTSDILSKPFNEWQPVGHRGPNQGTSVIKRENFLRLKGLDERFCGEYGWMYYDWRRRMLRLGMQFGSAGFYFYAIDSQSKLKRGMSKRNFRFMRMNARDETLQSPHGILNFQYTVEYMV